MKICIIGNSHVGAIKRAWDKMSPEHPKLEMIFFAHRGKGMVALKRQGKKLVPGSDDLASAMNFTSGGLGFIVPADYDAFLIYGLTAKPNFDSGDRFFSYQARFQAAKDFTHRNLSFKILKILRKLTDSKIYLGHNPLSSAVCLNSSESTAPYESGIVYLNEVIYFPLEAEMLMQPVSTIVNGQNTDASFTKGSQKLTIGTKSRKEDHADSEDKHMNQEFGEIWMSAFIARLNPPKISSQ